MIAACWSREGPMLRPLTESIEGALDWRARDNRAFPGGTAADRRPQTADDPRYLVARPRRPPGSDLLAADVSAPDLVLGWLWLVDEPAPASARGDRADEDVPQQGQ